MIPKDLIENNLIIMKKKLMEINMFKTIKLIFFF
jgi:hypothetical protein